MKHYIVWSPAPPLYGCGVDYEARILKWGVKGHETTPLPEFEQEVYARCPVVDRGGIPPGKIRRDG